MERLVYIGIILLFVAIILIIMGSIWGSNVRHGGIVFLGPIPIGWATDKKVFYTLIALSVVVLVLWVILNKI